MPLAYSKYLLALLQTHIPPTIRFLLSKMSNVQSTPAAGSLKNEQSTPQEATSPTNVDDSQAGTFDDIPLSPEGEAVMWGDLQPEIPRTSNWQPTSVEDFQYTSSEAASPSRSTRSSPSTSKIVITKSTTSAPNTKKTFSKPKTQDERIVQLLSLINRAERQVERLINDRGECHKDLAAWNIKEKEWNVALARLRMEAGKVRRERDELLGVVAELKKQVKHCEKNHW